MHRTAFAGLCACMSTFLLMRRQALHFWACAGSARAHGHAKHTHASMHNLRCTAVCVYVSWLNSLKCGSDDPPRLAFGAATSWRQPVRQGSTTGEGFCEDAAAAAC